jgi:predicted nucleic acid-binding protein
MLVLDTNVVSDLMRPVPSAPVLAWLDAQLADDLWLTSVTVAELLFGIERLPSGARRRALAKAAAQTVQEDFAGRLLVFSQEAASHFAVIAAQRERAGHALSMADGYIAAICLAHQATLVTRNVRDFARLGLTVLNPWEV